MSEPDRSEANKLGDRWLSTYVDLLRTGGASANCGDLADSLLSGLVADRRVALVGSATMTEPSGSTIDRHDVVVRTKYLGASRMQPELVTGRRVTIAYYNNAISNLARSYVTLHGASRDLGSLSLIVSKQRFESGAIPQIPLRLTCPTYIAPALLGTRAVLHLLAARPRELSVFGMDFYLAEQPHYPGDLNEQERTARGDVRDNAHYCLAFAQHDPFSQIRFVRHLAEAGAITPYGRTAEVLAMTDLEYAKGLEARYGRWDRP